MIDPDPDNPGQMRQVTLLSIKASSWEIPLLATQPGWVDCTVIAKYSPQVQYLEIAEIDIQSPSSSIPQLAAMNKEGVIASTIDEKPAALIPVEFEVLKWEPVVTAPDILYERNSAGNIVGLKVKVFQGEIMQLSAEVKIKVAAAGQQGNALATEWDLLLFQNLVTADPADLVQFVNGSFGMNVAPIPGQDSNTEGLGGDEESHLPKRKSFTANNETIAITLEDTPAYSLGLPIRNEKGDLRKVHRNLEFVSWLFAENKVTKKRVFIKWVRWRSRFELDFNLQLDPPHIKKVWDFKIIDQGDGVGPMKPVDELFKRFPFSNP